MRRRYVDGLPVGAGTLMELCGGDVRLVCLLQRWVRRYGRHQA